MHTFVTLLFTQGSSIAAGIATAHVYGPVGKGSIALAGLLITFAVTTSDGVRDAVAYQIGREKRDPRAVWGTAIVVLSVTAPIGVAVLLILWRLHPDQVAFLYAALAFPFGLYVQAVGVLYLLRDSVERINVQNSATIGGGTSLVTLALVLIFHAPVSLVLAFWVLAYVAAAVWGASAVRELIGGSALFRTPRLLREQLAFASKVALSSNITYLALRVDAFMVTALLAPALLGIYTLALATSELMFNLSKAVLWSSLGRIATLDFADSAALCARIVRSTIAMQFVVGTVVFLIGPMAITLVYGNRFEESGAVLRLLLPGVVFYSADGMLSSFIAVRAARPGLLLGLECVTLFVVAAITYVFISRLGVFAGALAHTVAFILAYAVKSAIFLRLTKLPIADVIVPRFADLPYSLRVRLRPTAQ
jgi:O-antigen/teichoic acid export membrane protein